MRKKRPGIGDEWGWNRSNLLLKKILEGKGNGKQTYNRRNFPELKKKWIAWKSQCVIKHE